MKGFRYLAKNVGLLTISQFGTKLLSFFLVPLYTNLLSTTEYGTYDLLNSTVALLIPILTMNICDSSLRFSIDKENDDSEIFSISLLHFVIGEMVLLLALILNRAIGLFPIIQNYEFLFFLLFSGTALNGILTYFARGIDCVKEVSISGVICSAAMLCLNVVFLIPLNMGLIGYFLANIIGIIVQCVYLFISIRGWKFLKWIQINQSLHKEMLNYSKPMIINNIAWWINNVSDRYIVTYLCGIAANGIYSVSYKIPSILTIFQTIFNQAWTLSAVKDFDSKDQNGFFSNMYNFYNVCMTVICSIFIIFSRVIAELLYAKDFYIAWKYVPFLLISVVFGALSGYLGGIFGAVKDTKIFAESTFISACVNIVLNIILVMKIGVVGAAIATAVAYVITWIIRLIKARKYIELHVNLKRDFVAYTILVIQSLFLYVFDEGSVFYILEMILFIGLMILYYKPILKMSLKIKCFIGEKKNYGKL